MTYTAINTMSKAKTSLDTPTQTNLAFLNAKEWENMQAMLDTPAQPTEAMKQLVKRGFKIVKQ